MTRVLFVESQASDPKVALKISDPAKLDIELVQVERLSTALRRLSRENFDVILVDLQLVDAHGIGIETVNQVQAAFAYLPIVLLVCRDDEPVALQAIKHGAQDFLIKETYTESRLVEAIQKAVVRKRAEKGLSYLAQYDDLTNVANRTLFKDRAVQALARVKRREGNVALLYLGLDHFKKVNEAQGHEGGDIILKAAGLRLQGCVREVDTVARRWGDEFTVLLEAVTGDGDVRTIADRILQAMSEPYEIGEEQVEVSASMGVAVFPRDGDRVDILLKAAETAMNLVKEDGGKTYRFCSSEGK